MKRLRGRLGLLLAISVMAGGCAGNSSTTPSTTTTSSSTVTDTFDGTLTKNGAAGYPFTVLASGSVSAVLTVSVLADGKTVAPAIGVGVGTWDTSSGSCSTANGKYKDDAVSPNAVTVTALGAGTLCVRIYDSKAIISAPVTYQVQVTHP